jgi:hypothetical protein
MSVVIYMNNYITVIMELYYLDYISYEHYVCPCFLCTGVLCLGSIGEDLNKVYASVHPSPPKLKDIRS